MNARTILFTLALIFGTTAPGYAPGRAVAPAVVDASVGAQCHTATTTPVDQPRWCKRPSAANRAACAAIAAARTTVPTEDSAQRPVAPQGQCPSPHRPVARGVSFFGSR